MIHRLLLTLTVMLAGALGAAAQTAGTTAAQPTAATGAHASGIYDVSLIPDSLKKNAHVVVREETQSLTILSPSKATFKSHIVATILDEQGDRYLHYAEYSSSARVLEDYDLYVYNAAGQPVQHIRQKEMGVSGYGDGLIEDGKATYYAVTAPSYPITVEEDFTRTYKGIFSYPDYELDNVECAFVKSEFVITTPADLGIRYKNHLLTLRPAIDSTAKNNHVYTWKATGICARPLEKNTRTDLVPKILISPTRFDYFNFPGDMSSWNSFGQWTYDLNKESLSLPETSKAFYRDMVAGATTDADKARILYAYLQKNFRYVSIQLGIGGLRSFPAAFTEKKKYGDCKALSTYLCACLDAVGVRSYTALINAGNGEAPVDPSFPYDGFDHVILCIPEPKDSIWLECTSKHTDFGVLSGFTENRNALLLTDKGGVLVHTPPSTMKENTSSCFTLVNLSEDGSGKASVAMLSAGERKFEMISGLYEEAHDEQKKFLVEDLDFVQPDDFSVQLNRLDTPVLKTQLDMSIEKIPEFTAGSKMFLNPRLYHIWPYRLPPADHRTENFCFANPFSNADTTCFVLPEGFVVDNLPKGKVLDCPYATYTSSYWYDAAKKSVYSSCILTVKTIEVPAIDYKKVKDFFGAVVADETEKIVINKP